MIEVREERWTELRSEMELLWPLQYAELSPLEQKWWEVDVGLFEELDSKGSLFTLALRDIDKKLVGYQWWLIRANPLYCRVLTAYETTTFVTPAARKLGWSGVRLVRFAEQQLRARGVMELKAHSKTWKSIVAIYLRRGFSVSDTLMTKWIGD